MFRRKRKRKASGFPFGVRKTAKTRGRGTPGFWALATVLAFPGVLLVADASGFSAAWSVVLAICASVSVIALEILVRGHMWIFEEKYVETFRHPKTPLRILAVAGGALLILESALILTVATDRGADDALLGLVLRKECAAGGNPTSRNLCRYLQGLPPEDDGTIDLIPASEKDAAGFALRSEAARRWFADEPLVTCANRYVGQLIDNETVSRHAAFIQCTAWRIDPQGRLQVKATRTAFVGARLERESDRLPRVTAWSDNPMSVTWDDALGELAEPTKTKTLSLTILEELRTVLYAESLGRAQRLLER